MASTAWLEHGSMATATVTDHKDNGAARRLASIRRLPRIHDLPARICGPGCTWVLLRPENLCDPCVRYQPLLGATARLLQPNMGQHQVRAGPQTPVGVVGDVNLAFWTTWFYPDPLCAKWAHWQREIASVLLPATDRPPVLMLPAQAPGCPVPAGRWGRRRVGGALTA
jgi:hypothetical protein